MKVSNKIILPDVFQMRVDELPGFTHVVKRLDSGGFKVKWARGWSEVTDIEWSICDEEEAEDFVASGDWIVVDEAKQEDSLPDVFYFEHKDKTCSGLVVKTKHGQSGWNVTWSKDSGGRTEFYSEFYIPSFIERGDWKIINKKPLTAEQLRANAEAREQISSLEHNIKLRKQDVEHAEILIKNYQERINQLSSKIVEEA